MSEKLKTPQEVIRANFLRTSIEGLFRRMGERSERKDFLRLNFSTTINTSIIFLGLPSISEIDSLIHDGEPIKGLSIDNVDIIADILASYTVEVKEAEERGDDKQLMIDSITNTIEDWVEAQRYPSFLHKPDR